ncbi:hypothetical protein JOM56_014917, partial [Amanita muscaria]
MTNHQHGYATFCMRFLNSRIRHAISSSPLRLEILRLDSSNDCVAILNGTSAPNVYYVVALVVRLFIYIDFRAGRSWELPLPVNPSFIKAG